jgi:hypothetical protein
LPQPLNCLHLYLLLCHLPARRRPPPWPLKCLPRQLLAGRALLSLSLSLSPEAVSLAPHFLPKVFPDNRIGVVAVPALVPASSRRPESAGTDIRAFTAPGSHVSRLLVRPCLRCQIRAARGAARIRASTTVRRYIPARRTRSSSRRHWRGQRSSSRRPLSCCSAKRRPLRASHKPLER